MTKTCIPLQVGVRYALTLQELAQTAGAEKSMICGSIARREPEVGDIDLVVQAAGLDRLKPIMEQEHRIQYRQLAQHGQINGTYHGVQVNIWIVPAADWAMKVWTLTLDKGHNIAYRMRAKKMGYRLNDRGLWANVNLISKDPEEILKIIKST